MNFSGTLQTETALSSAKNVSKMNVLIVDDVELNGLMLKGYVKQLDNVNPLSL